MVKSLGRSISTNPQLRGVLSQKNKMAGHRIYGSQKNLTMRVQVWRYGIIDITYNFYMESEAIVI